MPGIPAVNRWKLGWWKCECGKTGKIGRGGFHKHRDGPKCKAFFDGSEQLTPQINEEFHQQNIEEDIGQRPLANVTSNHSESQLEADMFEGFEGNLVASRGTQSELCYHHSC